MLDSEYEIYICDLLKRSLKTEQETSILYDKIEKLDVRVKKIERRNLLVQLVYKPKFWIVLIGLISVLISVSYELTKYI